MAAHEAALEGDTVRPWRAAGVEMIEDFGDRFHPKTSDYRPKVGDVAFFRMVSPEWGRHVTRVTRPVDGVDFETIGGNEAGSWRVTARKTTDPLFLGWGEV